MRRTSKRVDRINQRSTPLYRTTKRIGNFIVVETPANAGYAATYDYFRFDEDNKQWIRATSRQDKPSEWESLPEDMDARQQVL